MIIIVLVCCFNMMEQPQHMQSNNSKVVDITWDDVNGYVSMQTLCFHSQDCAVQADLKEGWREGGRWFLRI